MEAYMTQHLNQQSSRISNGKSSQSGAFPFLSLPPELQAAVLEHLSQPDLLALQTVSKTCHELASFKLWRDLDLQLESFGHHADGRPSRLMQIFQTLTCSDHDYAKHIRHFRLYGPQDDLMASRHATVFKIRFAAGSSAQQSLSINLLSLLRRASDLESFVLQVPLELSDAVWKAIASRQTLSKLDVSLHGRQLSFHNRHLSQALPPDFFVTSLPSSGFTYQYIEKCSKLKSLSLMHLCELDHLDRIAACIRASAATLTEFQLCLSDQLFEKSRKMSNLFAHPSNIPPPPPVEEFDEDESAVTIDQEIVPIVPDPNVAQAETETIRENKAEQDAALARIFSIEVEGIDKVVEKALKSAVDSKSEEPPQLDGATVERIPELLGKLFKGDKLTAEELEVIEKVRSQMNEALRSTKRAKHAKLPSGTSKGKHTVHKVVSPNTSDAVANKAVPWPGFPYTLPPQGGYPLPKVLPPSMAGPSSSSLPHFPVAVPPAKVSPAPGTEDVLGSFNFDSYIEDPPVTIGHAPQYSDIYGENPGLHQMMLEHLNHLKLPEKTLTSIAYLAAGHPPPLQHYQSSLKKLGQLAKKIKPSNKIASSIPSSSSYAGNEPSTSASSASLDPGSSSKESALYEDMNIDIEHPDEISGESGDDQESANEDEEGVALADDTKGKGKAKEPSSLRPASPAKRSLSQSLNEVGSKKETEENLSPEEAMRDWIRRKHGLTLQKLTLFLIPLKASVLGKALQLHCLREVVLLSVGGQGPFWQLLQRAQDEAPLALSRIQTDDVSRSFLECVSRLNRVDKLILRRRAKKDKLNTTTKESATIGEILKYAIQPHIKTLTVLSIQNDHDASWCLTREVVGLLCSRAISLQQIAVQSGATRFVELLRFSRSPEVLPRLEALYLINSGTDRPGLVTGGGTFLTPPPPPPLSTASSTIMPNGEPFDASHSNFLADNYCGCTSMIREWVRNRKEAGDVRFRIFGIRGSFVKASDAKEVTIKDYPAWLKDEYDTWRSELPSESAARSTSFQEWVKEQNPKIADRVHISFKTAHIKHYLSTPWSIFSYRVINAKLFS